MHDTLLCKCTLVQIHNLRNQKNLKPNESSNQKRKEMPMWFHLHAMIFMLSCLK